MNLNSLRIDLKKFADPQKANVYLRFFKTGKGQYGEGDVFIGVTVPDTRIVSKRYSNLSLDHIKTLLASKIHEERLCALLILVDQFKRADEKNRTRIYNLYLSNMRYVNNWDLVDLSADKIVGNYLSDKPKNVLLKLSKSNKLWERRIAIISTFYFIKNNESSWTLKIAQNLINDKHDLIHKAVGWMLREVGKRVDNKTLLLFLDKNAKIMPRTMLRYSIEHLDKDLRLKYLKK